MQKYRNTGSISRAVTLLLAIDEDDLGRKYTNTQLHRYRNTDLHKHTDTEIQKCRNTKIHKQSHPYLKIPNIDEDDLFF